MTEEHKFWVETFMKLTQGDHRYSGDNEGAKKYLHEANEFAKEMTEQVPLIDNFLTNQAAEDIARWRKTGEGELQPGHVLTREEQLYWELADNIDGKLYSQSNPLVANQLKALGYSVGTGKTLRTDSVHYCIMRPMSTWMIEVCVKKQKIVAIALNLNTTLLELNITDPDIYDVIDITEMVIKPVDQKAKDAVNELSRLRGEAVPKSDQPPTYALPRYLNEHDVSTEGWENLILAGYAGFQQAISYYHQKNVWVFECQTHKHKFVGGKDSNNVILATEDGIVKHKNFFDAYVDHVAVATGESVVVIAAVLKDKLESPDRGTPKAPEYSFGEDWEEQIKDNPKEYILKKYAEWKKVVEYGRNRPKILKFFFDCQASAHEFYGNPKDTLMSLVVEGVNVMSGREQQDVFCEHVHKITGMPHAEVELILVLGSKVAKLKGKIGKGGQINYIPQVGEAVLISGYNADDENGYAYLEQNVLWISETSILYGQKGCHPVLALLEQVHIKKHDQ